MGYDARLPGLTLAPQIAGYLSPTRTELLSGTDVDLVEEHIELMEAGIGMIWSNIALLEKLDTRWARLMSIDLAEVRIEHRQVSGYTEAALGS